VPAAIEDIARPARLEKLSGSADTWILNFGPQHPATHTTIHLVLELDGERILKCTPHIGYLHSGFEKLAEHHTYNQYVTVTDRMNYISPIANNIAWHGAVEKLLGIEITKRCKYLRTIIAELARIQDHLLSVGEAALEVGAMTVFVLLFNEREEINDLFEAVCGARFTTSWSRVGGAMADIPEGWTNYVESFCDKLTRAVDDCHTLLTRNPIFLERTKNVTPTTDAQVLNWGWTGPVARAAGVKRDLRKDEPYLAYSDLDFKVALARSGDVYSRYLVRLEEIEQSRKMIEQALKKIPPGEINIAADPKVMLAEKSEVYGSIEGVIHHFEVVMDNRGFSTPVSEVYAAQETANGELGFYIVADGSDKAFRVKVRSPSLQHLQAIGELLRGHTISEIVVALSSLNIIAAELDR